MRSGTILAKGDAVFTRAGRAAVPFVLVCLFALGAPSVALANHDAKLMQTGGKGLYSYNCWTGRRALAIKGLRLTTVPARSFSFGPGRHAVALEGTHRSDRAGQTEELRIATYPKGKAHLVFKNRTGELWGWKDKYHAVVRIETADYKLVKYVVDARTGKKKRYYGGTPKYGADLRAKATYGQRRYTVSVDSQNMVTVQLRSTGETLSYFRAPGTVGSWEWWSGTPEVSPDGHFLSFENSAMPYNDARVMYKVWTCTIKGADARRMKYAKGLSVWR